eukprot:630162-Pyramimonas_sp.AAC.1
MPPARPRPGRWGPSCSSPLPRARPSAAAGAGPPLATGVPRAAWQLASPRGPRAQQHGRAARSSGTVAPPKCQLSRSA